MDPSELTSIRTNFSFSLPNALLLLISIKNLDPISVGALSEEDKRTVLAVVVPVRHNLYVVTGVWSIDVNLIISPITTPEVKQSLSFATSLTATAVQPEEEPEHLMYSGRPVVMVSAFLYKPIPTDGATPQVVAVEQ